MATTLSEALRQIAGTYAVQVGKLIGCEPQYWVARDVSISACCFSDTWFLDLEEMQVIMDHLDEWVKKYGSQEKVGETVVKWMDWVIEDNVDEFGDYRNHPRINLWSWLMGMRLEHLKYRSDISEMVSLEHQANVLRYVLKTYPTSTIENAAKQIEARIKELKERQDKKTYL